MVIVMCIRQWLGTAVFMPASMLRNLQDQEELGSTATGLAAGQACKARTSQWMRTAPASGCRTRLRVKTVDTSLASYQPATGCLLGAAATCCNRMRLY